MTDAPGLVGVGHDHAATDEAAESDLLALEFALSDRRVSRSMRRPPSASGNGENLGDTNEDVLQEIGDAILDFLESRLDTQGDRERFGTDIDGLVAAQRDDRAARAIGATLDQLRDERVFDLRVVVGAPDLADDFELDAGLDARDNADDPSDIAMLENGDRVLFVGADASPEALVHRISTYTVSKIQGIAAANGIMIDPDRLARVIMNANALIAAEIMEGRFDLSLDFSEIRARFQRSAPG